jgi:hypothetical protein
METRRFSKHEIIDLIVSKATHGLFTGDRGDGEAPPITLQNFGTEMVRLGAKALRARLSRLPATEFRKEVIASLEHDKIRREWLSHHFARERRERQAELGRRHGLQPAILAAAGHYRGCRVRDRKMYAGEAWTAIKKEPYQTSDGETVMIEDDKMQVQSRARMQRRSPIKFGQWQKRYWVAAKPNSP